MFEKSKTGVARPRPTVPAEGRFRCGPRRLQPRGLLLIEAILLMVVLSILAVGMGYCLLGADANTPQNDQALAIDMALQSKMEYMEGQAFGKLVDGSPSTTFSDTVTLGGKTYSRLVNISDAAPNGGSGVATYKMIQVQIGGNSLYTLVSNP